MIGFCGCCSVNEKKVINSEYLRFKIREYYSSIIHMHINRMFRTRQRQIELVLYHLLYKHLLSEKGRMLYSSL